MQNCIDLSTCVYIDFAEFCNVAYRKAIKHISVRWLSLQTAVERALLQYSALKYYFLSKGTYNEHAILTLIK